LRFNSDGSIDDSYGPANGLAGHANSFVLQGDSLLVGGYSATFSGVNPRGVTRWNPGGSLDATFNTRVGREEDFLADVLSIAVQPAGTILVGGAFRSVNGMARYRLAQLNSDGSVVGSVEFNPPKSMPEGHFRVTTKNCPTVQVIIEGSSNLIDWTPIYTNTAPTGPLNFIDTNAAGLRQRFYRAVMKP